MHKNSTLSPPFQNVNFFLGVQGHENQLLVKESLCYQRVVGFGDYVPKLRGLVITHYVCWKMNIVSTMLYNVILHIYK